MNAANGERRRKILAVAAMGFGAMLGMGALGELLSVTVSNLMPAEVHEVPFMAKHHTELGLRAWVFGSNLVNLAAAFGFAWGGRMLLRRENGWATIRSAALALFCTTIVSIPVCAWYLFPMPIAGEARMASMMLALSMASASFGMLTVSTLWRSAATRRLGATA